MLIPLCNRIKSQDILKQHVQKQGSKPRASPLTQVWSNIHYLLPFSLHWKKAFWKPNTKVIKLTCKKTKKKRKRKQIWKSVKGKIKTTSIMIRVSWIFWFYDMGFLNFMVLWQGFVSLLRRYGVWFGFVCWYTGII
jgi:hypothetical protein